MPTEILDLDRADKRRRALLPAKRGRGRPRGSRNKTAKDPPKPLKLGYRIREFALALSISRSTVMRMIDDGTVKVVYIGAKLPIIPYSEAEKLLTPK